jgi:hypothetical protein
MRGGHGILSHAFPRDYRFDRKQDFVRCEDCDSLGPENIRKHEAGNFSVSLSDHPLIGIM